MAPAVLHRQVSVFVSDPPLDELSPVGVPTHGGHHESVRSSTGWAFQIVDDAAGRVNTLSILRVSVVQSGCASRLNVSRQEGPTRGCHHR